MCLQHVGFPFLWGIANGFRAVFGRGASPSLSDEACWFFPGMSAMQLALRVRPYILQQGRQPLSSNVFFIARMPPNTLGVVSVRGCVKCVS